jgi:hypothetical protein
MSDDDFDDDSGFDDEEYGDEGYDDDLAGQTRPLAGHESALVRQDLRDLVQFEETFAAEGFRGVAIFCQDCVEEHYYTWEMMRENLRSLLETGETPVHEPAFSPDPDDYVPWEYARGYVDALADVGAHDRREVGDCPRCRLRLRDEMKGASFCPRCGTPLLRERVRGVLAERGLDGDAIDEILRESGLP